MWGCGGHTRLVPRITKYCKHHPLWGLPRGSSAGNCPWPGRWGCKRKGGLSCPVLHLPWGWGPLWLLYCRPGTRMGGESFVKSECHENCYISLKAKKPITREPRIKPFKSDLSSMVSVHHHQKGHRFKEGKKEGKACPGKEACPAFPQPPPCPALLAAKPGTVGLRPLAGRKPPALGLRILSRTSRIVPTSLHPQRSYGANGIVGLSPSSVVQAWAYLTPLPGSHP